MASVVREGVVRAEFVRERAVRAVVLPCESKGHFKGEVYEFAEPVQASDGLSTPGTFFWLFRWLVDFLGGNQIPNFGGRMRAVLLGRTTDLLADGLSSSDVDEQEPLDGEVKGEDEDVREEAEDDPTRKHKVPIADEHMTVSSVMTRLSEAKRKSKGEAEDGGARRKSRKKADEDVDMEVKDEQLDEGEEPEQESVRGDSEDEQTGPLLRGDFSLSSLCLLGWMAQLMLKGPRAGSRWMLDTAEIKARSRAFLQALSDTFWQNVQGEVFQVVEGQLSVEALGKAEGKLAAKIFGKKKTVDVIEAMVVLQGDASRRSLSMDRRRLAEKLFSRLLQSLAKAIDASRGQDVWTATKVESLEQLRTASWLGFRV